jgi:hypothetical protein
MQKQLEQKKVLLSCLFRLRRRVRFRELALKKRDNKVKLPLSRESDEHCRAASVNHLATLAIRSCNPIT